MSYSVVKAGFERKGAFTFRLCEAVSGIIVMAPCLKMEALS